MQEQPVKPLIHELHCSSCGKLLQKWNDGRNNIESFVMLWYQMGDKHYCTECNEGGALNE